VSRWQRLAFRAKQFDPRTIPGLFAWWDPSNSTSVTLNGSAISALADVTGNGRNAVQAVGSAQPLIGTINDRNAIVGDNGDVLIATASYSITAQSTFAVFRAETYTSFGRIVTQESDTQNAVYIPLLLPNDSTFRIGSYFDGGYRSSMTIAQGASVIGESHHDGSTLRCVANGVSGATYTKALGFSPTKLALANGLSVSNALLGRIGEVLVWNRALTSAEIVRVRRYLSAKWRISVS
jgi:hypothetical protein